VLRVAWRKQLGLSIDQAALAGSDGTLAVVTARGEIAFVDAEGEEKARASAGTTSVGPATLTSDGTVVFVSSAGDAIGINRASPRARFVTRIGGERNVRAAPLPLDDGGVILATGSDLVVVDAEGNVRARVSLPEAPGAALLASGEKVIAVAGSGAVYAWAPGREPVRVGSFGAPVDGGAALADPSTLLAVIEGNHLVELDLTRGGRSTRAIASQGLYLGPPSVRLAAGGGAFASVLAQTQSRAFVLTLDSSGQEVQRAPIATFAPATLPDGGSAPLVAKPHTGPLVDPRGAVAFAAPDGRIGMVSPDGAVDTLGEMICPQAARAASVVGLTSFGPGSFVVTCEGGMLAKITGTEPESLRGRGATSPLRPSTSATRPPPPTGTPTGTDPD
jgi:hypothetical protein